MHEKPGRPLTVLHPSTVRANRLLAAMPHDALERLLQDIDRVWLDAGQMLHGADVDVKHAYFPADVIVTLMLESSGRAATKVAMIGREGVLGLEAFIGAEQPAGRRAVVLNDGYAFRLPIDALKAEFDRNGPAMRLLLRFLQSLITQMAQTAVCNRHHNVEPQLSTWLLACVDRLPTGTSLQVTQEQIAGMLGVRREGVSEAAGKLRQLGLIDFSRGRISLLDRPGLLARACECYGVIKNETARLLPDRPAT